VAIARNATPFDQCLFNAISIQRNFFSEKFDFNPVSLQTDIY